MSSSKPDSSAEYHRSISPTSRGSSTHRDSDNHALTASSRLEQSHKPTTAESDQNQNIQSQNLSPRSSPHIQAVDNDNAGILPPNMNDASSTRDFATNVEASMDEPSRRQLDERTKLLENYSHSHDCGNEHCDHGTFSPHPTHTRVASLEGKYSFGGRHDGEGGGSSISGETFGDTLRNRMFGQSSSRMSTTQYLARTHGIRNSKVMYVDIHATIQLTQFPMSIDNSRGLPL